mmetsp:Transcript_53891/g.138833  ORF Transcript_53891/g.138833 Transcript_53891/m.138833 type:complete len:479 (-) Transcript_53891:112-1548(-)
MDLRRVLHLEGEQQAHRLQGKAAAVHKVAEEEIVHRVDVSVVAIGGRLVPCEQAHQVQVLPVDVAIDLDRSAKLQHHVLRLQDVLHLVAELGHLGGVQQEAVGIRVGLPRGRLQQVLDDERGNTRRRPVAEVGDVCHDVGGLDFPALVLECLDSHLLHKVREVLLQAHVHLPSYLHVAENGVSHGGARSARGGRPPPRRRGGPRAWRLRRRVATTACAVVGRVEVDGASGGHAACLRGWLSHGALEGVLLRYSSAVIFCSPNRRRDRGGDGSVQVQDLQICSRRRRALVVEAAVRDEERAHAPAGVAEAVDAGYVSPLTGLRVVDGSREGLVHVGAAAADDQELRIQEDTGVLEPRLRRRPPLRRRLNPVPSAITMLAEAPGVLERPVVRRSAAEDHHHAGRRPLAADLGRVVDSWQRAARVHHGDLVPLERRSLHVQHPDVALGLLPVVPAKDYEQGLVEDHRVTIPPAGRRPEDRD